MAKLKHLIEYAAVRILAFWAQLLSARWADRLGAGLGTLVYHLAAGRRKIAGDNIRSTIGKSFAESEIESLTKKVFQNIGRTLIEIARFENLKSEEVSKIVEGDSSILKKIYDEGKGGIILTAHFGNWELLGTWPAVMGYPMHFLVGTQHNLEVDELLNSFRKKMGVGIISLAGSLRSIFKALKANHFVGIAADQHAPAGIRINFLGREASHARGPALFSIRTGAPICPFLIRRERFDKHIIISGEPIYPPNSGDEEKDIRTITLAFARFCEENIRLYPEQWMWTHRRWKL